MPDLVRAGALEQLDSYVDKYGFRDELQKIAPTYRDNQMKVDGKIYGFPDDGDRLHPLLPQGPVRGPEEPGGIQSEVRLRPGARRRPGKSTTRSSKFLTEKYAPKIYGAGQFRQPAYSQLLFQERFRVEGGKFFDPKTMKATVNSDIGVKVFDDMRAENKFMPPGVETWGFVEALTAFLNGDIAMTISWPPFGRFAAGYLAGEKALSWVPKIEDRRQGRLRLAAGWQAPAGARVLAERVLQEQEQGSRLSVHPVARTARRMSTERVQLPYTLRDPFRESHYTNAAYMARWADAPAYLKTLRAGADTGLLDLSILQVDKYEEALRQAMTRLWAGEPSKKILDDVAAQWDELTEKIGVDKQRAAYQDWANKPNAYPK